jgi:hypothetical protein
MSDLTALITLSTSGPDWSTGIHPRVHPRWTADQDAFLRSHLVDMLEPELAAALGHSANGIKIRRVRQQMTSPSKRPGWLTGNKVAHALGVDIHSVMLLDARQILKFERLPGPRQIRQITRLHLYMWAIVPEHWIYFRVANMGDGHLQRLVQLAQSRWPDAWWTIGQVAAYHGTDSNCINARIKSGKLPAARWGNWWIKRSDALKLHLWLGKGYSCKEWSPAADAYILRAHAAGLNDSEIGYRMKWSHQQVFYRRTLLTRKYAMQQTIPPEVLDEYTRLNEALHLPPCPDIESNHRVRANLAELERQWPGIQDYTERYSEEVE